MQTKLKLIPRLHCPCGSGAKIGKQHSQVAPGGRRPAFCAFGWLKLMHIGVHPRLPTSTAYAAWFRIPYRILPELLEFPMAQQ